MTKKIIFKFECRGRTLILDDSEYSVISYSGLEATDYEMEKTMNINYFGAKKKRKKILPRPISVEFDYIGDDKNKLQKRQELISFFSPFEPGVLEVNYLGMHRQIEYEVMGMLMNNTNIYDELSCLVELECPDPAFEDNIDESEAISAWVGGWSFPFTLPFQLKTKGDPRVNIVNEGHMEAPVIVEFHGPAINPYVKNLTTGKYIKIEAELGESQILYIDTAFGKKAIEIEEDGVRKDASAMMSYDSRFWNLQVGDNVIEYGSDNKLQENNVVVRYRNRYLGI